MAVSVKTLQTLGKLAERRREESARTLSGIHAEMHKENTLLTQYLAEIEKGVAEHYSPEAMALLPLYLQRMRALAEQSRQRLTNLTDAYEAAMEAVRAAHLDKTRYQTLLDSIKAHAKKTALDREQTLLDDNSQTVIARQSRLS